jgi:hypothetical protein
VGKGLWRTATFQEYAAGYAEYQRTGNPRAFVRAGSYDGMLYMGAAGGMSSVSKAAMTRDFVRGFRRSLESRKSVILPSAGGEGQKLSEALTEGFHEVTQSAKLRKAQQAAKASETPGEGAVRAGAGAADELPALQRTFDRLVDEQLIPSFRKLDPNLKYGYRGSFKTGRVGNPDKKTFGQPIDLNRFDIDFWIESDVLFQKYGSNLRANVEFRKVLAQTPGFGGLKPNKEGFSIRFLPTSR